jgi:hypothetical protein
VTDRVPEHTSDGRAVPQYIICVSGKAGPTFPGCHVVLQYSQFVVLLASYVKMHDATRTVTVEEPPPSLQSHSQPADKQSKQHR